MNSWIEFYLIRFNSFLVSAPHLNLVLTENAMGTWPICVRGLKCEMIK